MVLWCTEILQPSPKLPEMDGINHQSTWVVYCCITKHDYSSLFLGGFLGGSCHREIFGDGSWVFLRRFRAMAAIASWEMR